MMVRSYCGHLGAQWDRTLEAHLEPREPTLWSNLNSLEAHLEPGRPTLWSNLNTLKAHLGPRGPILWSNFNTLEAHLGPGAPTLWSNFNTLEAHIRRCPHYDIISILWKPIYDQGHLQSTLWSYFNIIETKLRKELPIFWYWYFITPFKRKGPAFDLLKDFQWVNYFAMLRFPDCEDVYY